MNVHELLGAMPEQPTKEAQIKIAGVNVGLDLEKPIDVSQMRVVYASNQPVETRCGMKFECLTKLTAELQNDEGGFDHLEIVIKRLSTKRPLTK
jgi:hypothetical protein